jgi:DNA (cytosine-5)-methyltransferase 1
MFGYLERGSQPSHLLIRPVASLRACAQDNTPLRVFIHLFGDSGMRLLDLFSGIGGFALAAQWVWGKNLDIVSFCEIDPFCQKVLKKHWPFVPICTDIRKMSYEWISTYSAGERPEKLGQERREQIQLNRNDNAWRPDILTGGFPCQPFSCAGQQRGKDDDRYLWPEMLRVIRETRPRWIVGENVAGIINLALDEVCASLEMEGYEVQPVIIPACAINAPHRRDRVWIIGHSTGEQGTGAIGKVSQRQNPNGNGSTGDAPNPKGEYGQRGQPIRDKQREPETPAGNANSHVANALHSTPSRHGQNSRGMDADPEPKRFDLGDWTRQWNQNWLEVATRLCNVDDGLSGGLVRPKRWRVNALKAGGNAIVPPLAAVFFQAIKEIQEIQG